MSQSIEVEADIIEKGIQKRNKILADAEIQSQKILEGAKAEAARVSTEADKQILQIVGSELKTVRLRIIGKTELQYKKTLMNKRGELLSNVYNQVESRLTNLAEGKSKDHDYKLILEKLVIEGVSAIGGTEVIISANKNDMDYIKKNIKKIGKNIEGVALKLDDSPLETLGGVVIKNASGTKIFYNTFEGRLARAMRGTESRIAKMLEMI
ncbi:MAG: V-type ATP synthase subunit E [Candidatus Bathyarchaeota archaeon]|jgi:vacuolar-type H+-ATPase subunit E/Vma4|nr:V-type ATP synthase subunit E [Candidatus Bathyarchaeota archaeon]